MNLNEKSYKILAELGKSEGVKTIRFNFPDRKKATILDFFGEVSDDKKIGIKISEAAMGGLGKVKISSEKKIHVKIHKNVAIATLSSQLAGWAIKINNGENDAIGSGPARILAKKPLDIIKKIGYYENSKKTALILETEILPNEKICKKILDECNAKELIIAAFKGNSRIGMINVLARIVEVGVFRLHTLGYNVKKINSAEGFVKIPPFSKNAMFDANDAIIYNSIVKIEVDDWDKKLTEKTVSKNSKFYGKSFKEIFEDVEGEFYRIPQDIFAPAEMRIIDLKNGREYRAGKFLKTQEKRKNG